MGRTKHIALAPLREGSKGLPGKNVRLFAGLPLYEHTVRQGLRCCDGCVVSTDIEEVLAGDYSDGRLLHRRPAYLAGDTTTMAEVLKEVIDSLSLNDLTIILLQVTSPLRHDKDIEDALELYRGGAFELVLSVTPDERSVLKSGMVEESRFLPVSKPEYCFANRQSLPMIYRPNGAIYVFSADWFIQNGGLEADRIGAVTMLSSRSCDIDSKEDFAEAERLFVAPSLD